MKPKNDPSVGRISRVGPRFARAARRNPPPRVYHATTHHGGLRCENEPCWPTLTTNPPYGVQSALRAVLQLRSVFAPRPWFLSLCFLLLLTSVVLSEPVGDKQSRPSPSLESLHHSPLPPGFFRGWCGLQDRILIETNGRIEVFDAGDKISTIPLVRGANFQCGNDGEHFFLFEQSVIGAGLIKGTVSETSIGRNIQHTVATYQTTRGFIPHIVVSPNSSSLATDASLDLTASSNAVQIILVNRPDNGSVSRIKWSSDGTLLFTVARLKGGLHTEVVQVLTDKLHEISHGTLPRGFFFRDGWVSSDGKLLWLYLGIEADENGNGVILRCTIDKFNCRHFAADVAGASMGGQDIFAIVRGVDRFRSRAEDNDADILPQRYVVEVLDGFMKLQARQGFASMERPHLEVTVSRSGKKAVLTWGSTSTAECSRDGGFALCETGIVVDLVGG